MSFSLGLHNSTRTQYEFAPSSSFASSSSSFRQDCYTRRTHASTIIKGCRRTSQATLDFHADVEEECYVSFFIRAWLDYDYLYIWFDTVWTLNSQESSSSGGLLAALQTDRGNRKKCPNRTEAKCKLTLTHRRNTPRPVNVGRFASRSSVLYRAQHILTHTRDRTLQTFLQRRAHIELCRARTRDCNAVIIHARSHYQKYVARTRDIGCRNILASVYSFESRARNKQR